MMSVQELFYGETEPVWIISTAAAQVIQHHVQPKPRAPPYGTEHRSQAKGHQQNNFQHIASNRDSPSQMGNQHHQRHQSPPRQSSPQHHAQLKHNGISQTNPSQLSDDQYNHHSQKGHQRHQSPPRQSSPQYQTPQHKQNGISQAYPSQHSDDQYNHYYQHNQKGQERHQSPVQQSSQQYHRDQNTHQNSSQFNPHQPSAPQINAHYKSQQQNFNQYTRPETKVVRMKVPICCEACEDRVVVALSTMRGVQSVECDLRKEKVTVTGNAPTADILKACKKLFKRSEMWEDRYY